MGTGSSWKTNRELNKYTIVTKPYVIVRYLDLDILFGIPFDEDMFIIINFCILYGKKYILDDCQINEESVCTDRFKTAQE